MTRPRHRSLPLLLSILVLASLGCPEPIFPNNGELSELSFMWRTSNIPRTDPTNAYATDPAAIAFGTALFHDTALSACGTVSCATCHTGEGLTFPEAFAPGCDGNMTGRNTPTLLNASYYDWFMWDGAADRLWSQARLPLLNPMEMASTPAIVRDRLNAQYLADYQALFGSTPDADTDDQMIANVGKAFAAYVSTLNRNDSPFDRELQDFLAAVDEGTEAEHPMYFGLKTFFRKGQCAVCHKGQFLTDNTFHNIGLADDSPGAGGHLAALAAMLDSPFAADGPYSDISSGAEVNRLANKRAATDELLAEWEGAFKTPTLRNIALTAPYMHDGSMETLAEVIEFYDRGGDAEGTFPGVKAVSIKPLDLTDEEKQALVDLLEMMTGAPIEE